MEATTEIIRMPDVVRITGLCRSLIYRLMNDDGPNPFPRPLRLGKRAVGWRRADVQQWLETRPEGGQSA